MSRVILEGYFAAKIQLGYEMTEAESEFVYLFVATFVSSNWFLGMTFGADGTTHRAVNYDSRHVHYKAQSYTGENDTAIKQTTRLLGVHSSLDGSSEESVKSWKQLLNGIAEIYNQSPLGQRTGHLLHVIDIFVKLTGMHSDHCAKERKDFHLMEKEKTLATHQSLGEDEILERSTQELLPIFEQANKQMIQDAGGSAKWNKLSTVEQAEHKAKMMEKLVIDVGKESFKMLSDDEKHILKLFVRAIPRTGQERIQSLLPRIIDTVRVRTWARKNPKRKL